MILVTSEAIVRRCLLKTMLRKFCKIHRKTLCHRVSFLIKLQTLGLGWVSTPCFFIGSRIQSVVIHKTLSKLLIQFITTFSFHTSRKYKKIFSTIINSTVWLTHFSPMFHFYIPWKHQKPLVFWCFQGV